jgi:hypothetical protein
MNNRLPEPDLVDFNIIPDLQHVRPRLPGHRLEVPHASGDDYFPTPNEGMKLFGKTALWCSALIGGGLALWLVTKDHSGQERLLHLTNVAINNVNDVVDGLRYRSGI